MKVAWWSGSVHEGEGESWRLCQDEIMKRAQRWPDHPDTPRLELLLVPDDFDLTQLDGDDWNDAPANCNAGAPSKSNLPEGAIWVDVPLGGEFTLG